MAQSKENTNTTFPYWDHRFKISITKNNLMLILDLIIISNFNKSETINIKQHTWRSTDNKMLGQSKWNDMVD